MNIMFVAINAESMTAFDGESFQPWALFAADLTHEIVLGFDLGGTGFISPETSSFENLVLLIHVCLY
jgi:hypothetical protein